MAGETLTLEGDASSPFFSPRAIFVLVFISHLLDHLHRHLKKRTTKDSEKVQLRQEIKQLLREANSLSSPSTFAQAAKLKRQAAAKEKELNKYQDGQLKEKNWFYILFGRVLFVAKAVLYLGLVWRFWGIPVVEVPNKLLQPLGGILANSVGKSSADLDPIGIIPWLMMTSQVSSLLCQKLSSLINL